MTKQEMDMIEDMLAEFARSIAQETAEDIISDLKNYIAEYRCITKSMLDELIEKYAFDYGVEVEND